jgi:hypothetical protein
MVCSTEILFKSGAPVSAPADFAAIQQAQIDFIACWDPYLSSLIDAPNCFRGQLWTRSDSAGGSDRTLSGFGTTDMAGNVKEWCLNESKDGTRLILGGGFGEPNHQ